MVQSNFFEILTFKSVYRYIIPGAVVTLIYGSFMWAMGWIGAAPDVNTAELSWSAKLVYWLTSGARWFSTMFFEFVVITLFSPIMALLSEHIENILNENEYPFSIKRMIIELMRTVGILVTGFIFSFFVILLWNLIAWIGNLQMITPYIVFIVKAFFIGFNFFDYALERNLVSVGASWRYAINRPILMLVVGGLFSLLFLIPVFGVMIAPFLATILATILWFHDQNPSQRYRKPKVD
jgi:CysZ protein